MFTSLEKWARDHAIFVLFQTGCASLDTEIVPRTVKNNIKKRRNKRDKKKRKTNTPFHQTQPKPPNIPLKRVPDKKAEKKFGRLSTKTNKHTSASRRIPCFLLFSIFNLSSSLSCHARPLFFSSGFLPFVSLSRHSF